MPLLRAEAEKLSNNMLERGVIEEVIDRDDLLALLPFMRVEGKAYVYNRENTTTEGDFLDPNEAVNEGGADFIEVTTKLRILAGDVDVDKFLLTTHSDTNDQLAIQLAMKAKAMTRKLRRTIANGNSAVNAKEFDGVSRLVTAPQTIFAGANGGPVNFELLDQLLDLVKNGADCIMMRDGTWRAIRALMRATGGITPDMIQVENFGRPIPGYNGVPVIVNDFLPINETRGSSNNTTSIYALRLNEVDGFHMIYGGPASAGLQVEEIGTVQNKDAYRYRMKWYIGSALKSTLSLARLAGVTNI